jgi:adenylate cyclase
VSRRPAAAPRAVVPRLEELASCFQGIVPSTFFTCSTDGIPNTAYLSHVEYVDPCHVALSFQFFNKSRRNVAENPHALVHVIDPDTAQGWALRLRYVRSETEGPLFERMALRIEAIASYCGMKGTFKLLASDVYEVLDIAPVPEVRGLAGAEPSGGRRPRPDAVFTLQALQDFSVRLNTAETLEQLLDAALENVERVFGFEHSMILLAGEQPGTLITIATRGYPETGVGSEVRHGEGIVGMVAEARKPIRISGLLRGMLYAYAARHRAEETGWCSTSQRIPLPGLQNPASQLGVPLVARGELIGVLCIESETPYRFHEDDKASIELLGSYLAIAIQNVLLRIQNLLLEPGEFVPPAALASVPAAPPCQADAPVTHEIAYYRADEVVMVDGDYLIRGLPARILWKLLTIRDGEGRCEFTNRELRLDKSLNLPGYKDNLETRLLLLRRRLEQKVPDLRLVPRARGRFALEVTGRVTLAERP